MDISDLLLVAAGLAVPAGLAWYVSRRRPNQTASTPQRTLPGKGIGAALKRGWGGRVDQSTLDHFEETLLAADLGPAVTDSVIRSVKKTDPDTAEGATAAVALELRNQFTDANRGLALDRNPAIVLVVGVNGSGKTTSIAKLAKLLKDDGRTVVMGAADTFRAAAAEQLTTWGDRLGFRVVRGSEGSDPASVAHDAISAARASGADVTLIDTAGRLHGKKNLMSELAKIYRVAGGNDGLVGEVLLVLDATTGQNGLAQVREFASTVPVTGIVLTKLDGTARGGIVVAVEKDLGVPVKFVGVGEGIDDLRPFDPDRFIADLLEAP